MLIVSGPGPWTVLAGRGRVWRTRTPTTTYALCLCVKPARHCVSSFACFSSLRIIITDDVTAPTPPPGASIRPPAGPTAQLYLYVIPPQPCHPLPHLPFIRRGAIIGLTCRVGRAIWGSAEMVRDLVTSGASVLFLGR